MSRAYPSDQKAAALIALERNRGNVPLTARQTGIPVRTLYQWQCNVLPYLQQHTPLVQQVAETPAFESDLDALAFIRQNILAELSRLSASLQYDPGFSTPYQRAQVMSQLMDRLLKLDLHLQPYTQDDEADRFRAMLAAEFEGEEPNDDPNEDYDDDDLEVYHTGWQTISSGSEPDSGSSL